MNILLPIPIVLIVFGVAFAAQPSQEGEIISIQVHNRDDGVTDVVLVKLDGILDDAGFECITRTQWLIDLTDPSGKSMYAALLAAYIQKLPIRLSGQPDNPCSVDRLVGYPLVRNLFLYSDSAD